jgi:hypothetical protein
LNHPASNIHSAVTIVAYKPTHPDRVYIRRGPKFDDGQEFYGFSSNRQSSSNDSASAAHRAGAASETFGSRKISQKA